MTKDQQRLVILQAVKENMNGKCSRKLESCPRFLAETLYQDENIWDCEDCAKTFNYIIDDDNNSAIVSQCPCVYCRNVEEPIIALEDEIERLVQVILTDLNNF